MPRRSRALAGGGELPAGRRRSGGTRPGAGMGMAGPHARSGLECGSRRPPPDAQGTFVRSERKIGRNEPCPCGSGKKYKHCHGALSSVE